MQIRRNYGTYNSFKTTEPRKQKILEKVIFKVIKKIFEKKLLNFICVA